MPAPWRRGMPVPYPFYLFMVGTIATLILFVQQPELATRALSLFSLTPTSVLEEVQHTFPHAGYDGDAVKRKRVAIVGAGASGSAAAFFLARAAREAESRAGVEHGSLLDIVVYERENYIGGRELVVETPNSLGLNDLAKERQRKPAGIPMPSLTRRQHRRLPARRQDHAACRARREHLR